MKIEKISDCTVKITLSITDMQNLNINYKNFHPDDPKANEVFWRMIHIATEKTGIVFENCKLTVEVMQKNDHTFVFFITKQEREISLEENKFRKINAAPQPLVKEQSVLLYKFNSFDDVCTFAKNNLYYCFLLGDGNSLFNYNNLYWLMVDVKPELRSHVERFNSTVSEYAQLVENSVIFSSYLNEHGETIIKSGALKIIYNNFK